MALTARIPTGSDTAGFVPEQWSKKALDAVHHRLVVVPVVDHQWEPELKKGDTMNVGVLNTVTATEVTVGTEGVVNDIATGSKLQIVIDQYWEAPVVFDDMTNFQTQVNLVAKGQRESGYAIAKEMDTSLCDLFSSLNGGTVRGSSPILITNNLTAVSSGTGSYGCYLHKEALAIIAQENSKVDLVKQPLKHQITVNTTALWGVLEMRDTFGVPIYTRLA